MCIKIQKIYSRLFSKFIKENVYLNKTPKGFSSKRQIFSILKLLRINNKSSEKEQNY